MTIHKGIDDLLAAGGTPRRFAGMQVDQFFKRLQVFHENERAVPSTLEAHSVSYRSSRPPFPTEVFPNAVRRFIQQVADATGCPLDFPAVGALVVSGAAVGAARGILLKTGWIEQPSMYAAIVAPPGRVKTPALKAVMGPIYDEQDRRRHVHRAAVTRYQDELAAYKQSSRLDQDASGDISQESACRPIAPPPMRHLFTSDTTVEALAVNLESNPKGLLIFRDEFTGWVQSMNQYRRGADRQFFLSAWSNEMIKVDRKTSQAGPIIVRHPFLSALGGIQPDMLSSLEARGGAQDGFLDRVLFAYPDDQPFQGWTDVELDEDTQRAWRIILGRLLALEPHRPESDSDTPVILHLDHHGRMEFAAFQDRVADEMNTSNFPPRIVGACAKLRGYCARFCLVIHLLRWAAGELQESEGEGYVDADDVRRAVRLCDYFKAHAMAVHGCLTLSDEDKSVDAFLMWMRRNNMTEVRPRDVVRANVAGIKKSSDAKALMEAAADRGHGEFEYTGVQKRSARFVINRGA